jgi:hypothetical protein
MRCNTCHGTGWLRVERPYIEGVAITVVMEPCPDCYDLGVCPRCGKHTCTEVRAPEAPLEVCGCGWNSDIGWSEAASRKGER